jgi:hypothetical protein
MFACTLLTALALAAPPGPDAGKRAAELVAALGAPLFRDREKAERELLEIGYAAKDAVLAGQKSKDGEVSERCRKLYPVLWRMDLEKRVDRFLSDPDGAVPADLPGASRWLKTVGDSKASRELYAMTVKAHPEPLLDVELHPDRLAQAYTDFARDVYSRLYPRPAGAAPGGVRAADDSEVLLFFFLGAAGEVRQTIPRGISTTYVYQFLNAAYLQRQLGPEAANEPFRRLFAAWLEKERYTLLLRRGMDIAAQHKVRECGPTLLKIATDANTLPANQATAVLGFARLGTKDDIPTLAPLLKNENLVCRTAINGELGSVLVRDVALGASIQMAGQDPADFGFERRLPVGALNVSYIYYAFTSDEKRAAAHEKWQAWAKGHLSK